MVQPSASDKTPNEQAFDILSQFPGFQQALKDVRGSMPPAVDPAPTTESTDLLARKGTPEERARLVSTLTGSYPGFDQRIEQLQTEIPNPVKRADTFWGQVTDIGGNVIGRALDLLDLPASGVERAIGMAYWNEIPLADRWHMAAITYDSIATDLFSAGRSKQHAIDDYYAGAKTLDQIEQDNQNVWGDMAGHFVLDPMWLIGGLPLLTKVLPASAKANTFVRVLAEGINLADSPLRNVPILGKLGQPVHDEKMMDDLLRLEDTTGPDIFAPRRTGAIQRARELNPAGKVDQLIDSALTTFAGISDPSLHLWEGDGAGVLQLVNDLASPSNLRHDFAGKYSSGLAVRNVRAFLQEAPDLARQMKEYESLRPISLANDYWKGARASLLTERNGEAVNMVDILAAGGRLSPAEQARYYAVRTAYFMDELIAKTDKAMYATLGTEGDFLSKVDAFSSGMKSWLSLATINNPKFVAMNYASNAFMIAAKGHDLAGALRYLRNPTKFSDDELRILNDFGESAMLVNRAAGDTSFTSEYLPALVGQQKGLQAVTHNVVDKVGWFLKYSSDLDQGARVRSYLKGVQDASHAVWKFGDGGVLPALPQELADIPGLASAINGMAMKGFDEVGRLRAAAHGDDFITGRGMIDAALRETAARMDLPPGGLEALKTSIPDNLVSEFDDLVEGIKLSRKQGGDYIAHMNSQIQKLSDDLELLTFRKMTASGMQVPPLPGVNPAAVGVPWQDAAHHEVLGQQMQEVVSRWLAAHEPALGTDGVREMQSILHRDVDEYLNLIDQGYDAGKYSDGVGTHAQDILRGLQATLESRSAGLGQDFLTSLGLPLRTLFADMADGRKLAGADFNALHVAERNRLQQILHDVGIEMPKEYLRPEFPTAGGAHATIAATMQSVLDYARRALPDVFSLSSPLDDDVAASLRAYLDGPLSQAMRERNIVAQTHGRTMRDFVMLNYTRKYGIDGALQLLFPYNFWIGRTLKDWGRMTLARPGVTAAMTRLYDGVQEINDNENLPARLRTMIRIPVSFLDDMLPGSGFGNGVYFDPIKLLNPLSNFQTDTDFDRGLNLTNAGKAYSWATQASPFATNPFITLGLGATGMLGERDTYVRRALTSLSGVPFGIPAPKLERAVHDFFAGISDNPAPEVLTARNKALLAAGQPLPEKDLRNWFEEGWDATATDGFDGFRIDRVIAGMVAEDPNRWTPRAGAEAMKFRSGTLFNEARKRAGTSQGLAVLTGWLAMPVRLYPEGERVQNGLDAMYRQVIASKNPDDIEKFFGRFSEYQLRNAAYADTPAEGRKVLDTQMFYQDVGAVEAKYAGQIDQLKGAKRSGEQAGFLQTKEGRRQLDVIDTDLKFLAQMKQKEVDRLDGLYPERNSELTLHAAPHERALHDLREQFFAIRPDQYKTADEFYAARTAFVQRLPTASSAGEWVAAAALAIATWDAAAEHMAQTAGDHEATTKVLEARDKKLRSLTTSVTATISRDEFQSYLSRGAQPPTKQAEEYRQAVTQLNGYFAIAEADGLSQASKAALQRKYWKGYPLLQKYYGADEPVAADAVTAGVMGRMDKLWQGYYDLGNNPRSQRDYLAAHLPELNTLRGRVALPPVNLKNWERVLPPAEVGPSADVLKDLTP